MAAKAEDQPRGEQIRRQHDEHLNQRGDGHGGDEQECDEHAAELKKAYGADVEVIADCSPAKLKAKMEEMSKGSGEQVLVDILAHGAHDDSGKNEGNMALGKKDGDQWLHEQDLKDMVNKNLAPHYKNVNVLIESCYSGNFVQ